MFCTSCGTENPNTSTTCRACGAQMALNPYQASASGGIGGPPVSNYLVQAILVTLCCCLPFGIPAIVYAAQVDGHVRAGDYQRAVDSANSAKMWCWIGFGLGLFVQVAYWGLAILGAMAGAVQPH